MMRVRPSLKSRIISQGGGSVFLKSATLLLPPFSLFSTSVKGFQSFPEGEVRRVNARREEKERDIMRTPCAMRFKQ